MVERKKKTKKPIKKIARAKVGRTKTTKNKTVKKVARRVVKKATKKATRAKKRVPATSILPKHRGNPIMGPAHDSPWQSAAVLNPAALTQDGKIHLFYRALGHEGISRIGHATSTDGIHFARSKEPVFVAQNITEAKKHWPRTSPARLTYNKELYASGGGWGGCEDPRAVNIEGRVYLTFNMFNGWNSMRVAYTSISESDLRNNIWNWDDFEYLSRPGDRQKNWILFPEKINGKFALFHNLDMGDPTRVHIAYLNDLDMYKTPNQKEAPDPQALPDHTVAWHNRTRSASAPPIKTTSGWLLFYHAMDKDDPGRYKVGAMLLDLTDPTKVLYRSNYPILEPDEWYENDWKPGIVYANGAVVKDGTLYLYYGGGDKYVAVAHTKLDDFLRKLTHSEHMVLSLKPTFTA